MIESTALARLRGGESGRWGNISKAQLDSQGKKAELSDLLGDVVTTDETGLVVFGSLARNEYTSGSDLDWTLLVDSRADSGHFRTMRQISEKLQGHFGAPGPSGVFGGLIFSHDLVHLIGGDDDTNKNMTRRLLLLLESTSIGPSTSRQVHERIVKVILRRYLEEDASFISGNNKPGRIPRFLLNDVVRLWRTIAVDYANKYRARGGQKWALRNIKLRMSRKLIFLSGFLMCITWALRDDGSEDDMIVPKLVSYLTEWTQRAPLESIALVVEEFAPNLASDIFDHYDEFLGILDNSEKRERLEELSPSAAYLDPLFLSVRDTAMGFDKALTDLLFHSDQRLVALVTKYGVF